MITKILFQAPTEGFAFDFEGSKSAMVEKRIGTVAAYKKWKKPVMPLEICSLTFPLCFNLNICAQNCLVIN